LSPQGGYPLIKIGIIFLIESESSGLVG